MNGCVPEGSSMQRKHNRRESSSRYSSGVLEDEECCCGIPLCDVLEREQVANCL